MPRDYKRKAGGWRDSPSYRSVSCEECGTVFKQKTWHHKYCSDTCKGKVKYSSGNVTTESQYKNISGNWERYIQRLLYFGGRRRDKLTKDILLEKLIDQNYRCALTGVELTCKLEKGKTFPTNVSVDRIVAGGEYTKENIQLVCRAVNSWRSNLPVNEFVYWCRKVVETADDNKKS